jgi:enoyl-CoA hydratase
MPSPTDPTVWHSFRVEKSAHVATVFLSNEKKRNAMGPTFWDELPQLFAQLDSDPTVRVIVLAADGPVWTAGLDLLAMMPRLQSTEPGRIPQQRHLHGLIRTLQDAISAVERCRQPVIAAIHGKCIGGGIDLITACDIRLCSRDALFSVREVRVAIVADVGTLQRLPRIVGEGQARQLALSGEDFNADRALQIGLVNSVHSDRDSLLAAAQALATTIAKNSPLAVQGTKRVLNETRDQSVEDGLRHVALHNTAYLMSDDLAEAVSAFVEKREPTFTGR